MKYSGQCSLVMYKYFTLEGAVCYTALFEVRSQLENIKLNLINTPMKCFCEKNKYSDTIEEKKSKY